MLKLNPIYFIRDGFPENEGWESTGMRGVVDSVQQFDRRFGDILRLHNRKVAVVYEEHTKDDQPAEDGWRWRKWGPYFGEQSPQAEYLADEPEISRVFTFRIFVK
jgi:hypothetical protein